MISLQEGLALINRKAPDGRKAEFSIDFIKISTGEIISIKRAETCGSKPNQRANRIIGIRDLDAGREINIKIHGIKRINNQCIYE